MRTPDPQSPRRAHAPLVPAAFATGALAALLTTVPLAEPAGAHGGQQQVGVIVRELTLAPTDGRWVATLSLTALETGDHISYAEAKLAAGSTAPVALEQTDTAGQYRGTLPAAVSGTTPLALSVRSLPGGALVRPFDATYPGVALSGTSPVVVVGAPADGGDESMGGVAAAGAGVLALGGLVLALRRRSTARWPVMAAAGH